MSGPVTVREVALDKELARRKGQSLASLCQDVGALWAFPSSDPADWAENHREVPEPSPFPGKWSNELTPYLVKPMRHLSSIDPCRRVVCMLSSQRGKTEIALNFIGWIMDADPGATLMIMPSVVPMGEALSKERLAPMIRVTPSLARKVSKPKSVNSDNTIFHKSFPSGDLDIVGANSPSGLSSRPKRYLIADEIGRWTKTAEGDPLLLARKRLQVYRAMGVSKELLVSSPNMPESDIHHEYLTCKQRWEEQTECPDCGGRQFPSLKHFSFDANNPSTVHYVCDSCARRFSLEEQGLVKSTARWVCVHGEENKRPESIGFHANQWMSPFSTWDATLGEWLEAKGDPLKEQVVTNTVFAEPWEGSGEKVDADSLAARVENWGKFVPPQVKIITCGVDLQIDRAELEVVGWGGGEESWSLAYEVLPGSPTEPELYEDLAEYLSRTWPCSDDKQMRIVSACIDSGHWTRSVYEFVRRMRKRWLYPVKGASSFSADPIAGTPRELRRRTTRRMLTGRPAEMVGVSQIKLVVFNRLRLPANAAGCCHFPMERTPAYFEQLTGERLVRSRPRMGPAQYAWEQVESNVEALDCRVYAYAALLLSGLPVDGHPAGRVSAAVTNQVPPTKEAARKAHTPPPARAPSRAAPPRQRPRPRRVR